MSGKSERKPDNRIADLERQVRLMKKRQASLEIAFAELAAICKQVVNTISKVMSRLDVGVEVPKSLKARIGKFMTSVGDE